MSASGGGSNGGGTPVTVGSNNANAPVVSTMPAVAGKTNYVTGFEVTAGGATAGALVQVTLTGVIGGPIPYAFAVPAGAALAAQPLIVAFPTPIPATGPNVACAINVPAVGAGNVNTTATIHGYVV